MKNVLVVCSQNWVRAPTAELVFAADLDVETASAGLNTDAINPLTAELVAWANIIFVLEKAHRFKLQKIQAPSQGCARHLPGYSRRLRLYGSGAGAAAGSACATVSVAPAGTTSCGRRRSCL